MAVPKRKTSKQRKRIRRSHHKLNVPSLSPCPRCGSATMPHRICHNCGYHRGSKDVVIEFDDYETAKRAYHDPAYQEVAEIRRRTATSTIILVEGT